jgi:hypothetical protein
LIFGGVMPVGGRNRRPQQTDNAIDMPDGD